MNGTINCIQVNDTENRGIALGVNVRFDDVHACIFIHFVRNSQVPLNQCAWIGSALASKREKEVDASDLKTQHSVLITSTDKDTVVLRQTTPPRRCYLNILPAHTTSSTRISGGEECCCGRVMDGNAGAFIHYIYSLAPMLREEVLNELGKLWLVELAS